MLPLSPRQHPLRRVGTHLRLRPQDGLLRPMQVQVEALRQHVDHCQVDAALRPLLLDEGVADGEVARTPPGVA